MNSQKPKCHRCGRHRREQETLCPECQMRDLIATLDPQKLESMRERIREGRNIQAVKEAHELLKSSLKDAVDLMYFLEAQEKANRPTPELGD